MEDLEEDMPPVVALLVERVTGDAFTSLNLEVTRLLMARSGLADEAPLLAGATEPDHAVVVAAERAEGLGGGGGSLWDALCEAPCRCRGLEPRRVSVLRVPL